MPSRTLVVVNPHSRSGATGRRWADVETRLRDALGPLEVEFTRGPRAAERIAREGARAGVERILVAGGDGTTSEVVTGLLAAELGGYVQLGLLPLGTGSDLARTLGVPRALDAAIEQIKTGRERRIDAGRACYREPGGRDAVSYFLNVASLGLSGAVVSLVNRAPKHLGPGFSYLAGTLRGLVAWRDVDVTLTLDGQIVHDGPLVFATASNGRYFGGGMFVTPDAKPDDGRFDVVVVPGTPKLRMLRNLPRLYRGTHLAAPEVALHRGRVLEARSSETVRIDVDGEPLGSLPARFEVMPGAITLFGVAA